MRDTDSRVGMRRDGGGVLSARAGALVARLARQERALHRGSWAESRIAVREDYGIPGDRSSLKPRAAPSAQAAGCSESAPPASPRCVCWLIIF